RLNEIAKVVLLHGMGGTGALWRPVAAGLEEHCSILAPDQRGHGQSTVDLKTGFAPLDYGRDVQDTLKARSFSPAYVVGHSMGVRTACAIAHLEPDLVRGLVLVDIGLEGAAGGGLGDTLGSFLRILPMTFPDRAQARDFVQARCPDPAIGQYLMAVLALGQKSAQGVTFPFQKEALLKTIDEAKKADLRPWIRDFAALGRPVIILRGQKTTVWTEAEFDDERRRFADLPSIRFENWPDTGHGLPFDQRAKFTQCITEMIRSDASHISPRNPA
ncbi:MAG TPA: alpha/beta hydrolase, partial [Bdellovibrionota bacterium]|nr:alpha/beta hydrolase [Bdellovibrionota bacterium]